MRSFVKYFILLSLFWTLGGYAQSSKNQDLLLEISRSIYNNNLDRALNLVDQVQYLFDKETFISDEKRNSEIHSRKEILKYLVRLFYYDFHPTKETRTANFTDLISSMINPNCPDDSTEPEKTIFSEKQLFQQLLQRYKELSALRTYWDIGTYKNLRKKSLDEIFKNTDLMNSEYFKLVLSLHPENLQEKTDQRLESNKVFKEIFKSSLDIQNKEDLKNALLFRDSITKIDTVLDFDLLNLNKEMLIPQMISLPDLEIFNEQIIKGSSKTIPYPKITNNKAKPAGHFFDLFNEIAKKERNLDLLVDVPNINLESFNLIAIDPGTFKMGSPADEKGRNDDETLHEVELTKKTIIQATTVTQLQWYVLTGEKPSHFNKKEHCPETYNEKLQMCPNNPVEKVSFNKIQEVLKAFNEKAKAYGYPNLKFSLPTEAEWEYAARGGTQTRFHWGNDESKEVMGEYAWYKENSNQHTHEVGKLKPNQYGLYDMSGNVWQWTADTYEKDYLLTKQVDLFKDSNDPGTLRSLRGGDVWLNFDSARAARRNGNDPTCGWDLYGLRFRQDPN